MKKQIKFTEVTAKAVTFEKGEIKTVNLVPFVYNGRKMSETAIKKEFMGQAEKLIKDFKGQILIVEEKEVNKIYEFELADFLKIAKEVIEEEEKAE